MAQSLGIVDLIWNGTKIPVEKGATFKQGGVIYKPVVAGQQVSYSGEMMASEVKATTPLMAGQSLLALIAVTSGQLQFLCDTGQTYVIENAFLTGQQEITGGEGGKITLMWAGPAASEVLT